jgi:acyl-CoA reductase-like NAD-dependent aldehyde dehydrogenase
MTGKQETKCFNPVTGKQIGTSPLHGLEELVDAINLAGKEQITWAALGAKERASRILKLRGYIVDNANVISETISSDNGKLPLDALAAEVLPTAMGISYYCNNAPRFLKPQKIKGGNIFFINKRSKILRKPYGVIGIISPWNYPWSIAMSEIVMGLLAGNTIIFKAASETQMVGLAIKAAFDSIGLPEGVFNYINMPGRIAGDAFLESGIDKLFFTGSVPIGKTLMAKAAESLTPINLELGGNDAMIVCEDADPYRAAKGALWAGFQNAGQSCGGVERVYVQEGIYDDFVGRLKKEIDGLRVGTSFKNECDMGAMTTSRQKKLVEDHVDDAIKKGALVFAKSSVPEDAGLNNFLPAIVLTEVTHEMDVMKYETFGPVIGVMRVKTIEEAIMLANDSDLGLTGSVWSKNNKKAQNIAAKIRAGAITINDHLMSHGLVETPWGGVKESGIGRSHGELGFNEMTISQTIVNDIMPGVKKNIWWHPFSEKIYQGILGVMKTLYGKSISQKLSGLKNVLKILPRMFRE